MTIIAISAILTLQNTSRAIILSAEQYSQLYIWAAVALPVVLAGAFGNILTLIVILRARWYATGIQVLILKLTVCEVLTTCIIYPLLIIGTLVADVSLWQIPGVCQLMAYLFYSITCTIPLMCAMIAVNQFCLIVLPGLTRGTTQRAGGIMMISLSFTISLLTFAIPLSGIDGRFGLIEPINICVWQHWTASQTFQTGFILLIYVIPGGTIATCYVFIFLFIRLRRCTCVPLQAGRVLCRLIQTTKTMGLTFLVYAICYLPLNLMAWASVHKFVEPHSTVYAWLLLLYISSDCLHPVWQ
ncbi:hypothetical protein BV898_04138 [Hypsibius exemplaris]|uniref:G-protein coupled receptors family 1 profile domain-containing protein n=1 Tax=Hypsibius exemplaris TaxID=2072580 RepID=A0A1W0X347_HYPEX|nr:hypothetical protein BV898_04138 [Hypsibius exemplaris]